MTEQELVEAALREWQKRPRYPGRSHCQSRRRSVRYQRESIQDWYEKQDFTQPLVSDSDSDEDETVLGAGARDEDEDDEAETRTEKERSMRQQRRGCTGDTVRTTYPAVGRLFQRRRRSSC